MRAAPPDLPGAQTTDSPIDRALALLLADETEAALRWSAAVVERDAVDAERARHHVPAARADGPDRGGGRGLRAGGAARHRRGRTCRWRSPPSAISARSGSTCAATSTALASAFCLGSDRADRDRDAAAAAAALRGLPAPELLSHRPGADVEGDADHPRGQARLRRGGRLGDPAHRAPAALQRACPRRRCAISSAPSR